MPTPLSVFARPLLLTAAARQQVRVPVLVWGGALPGLSRTESEDEADTTRVGIAALSQLPGDPLVIELKKSNQRMNAFALGVTVGRTENNDVVFPDESVSRFHGYFREEAGGTRWTFTDAGSTNGTFVAGVPLVPSKAFLLGARTQMRFGSVEVLFLMPDALWAFIEERSR